MANYSPAVLEHDGPAEWEVLLSWPASCPGQGPDADVDALDHLVIDTLIAARAGRSALAASPAATPTS